MTKSSSIKLAYILFTDIDDFTLSGSRIIQPYIKGKMSCTLLSVQKVASTKLELRILSRLRIKVSSNVQFWKSISKRRRSAH